MVRQLRWALAWLFAFATPAYAGNDDALLVGGEASMTGGAVVATTGTGAALYYNPAGLAGAEHDSLNLSGSAYTLRLYQTPALLTSVDGEEASATVRELVVVPTALTYVRTLPRGIRLGLGVFVPQSLDWSHKTQLEGLDTMAMPRRWLITIDERRIEYRALAGVGFPLAGGLRLGFALETLYDSRRRAFVFSSLPEDATAATQASRFVSDVGVGGGASVGLQWRPIDGFSFGISVRSPLFYVYSSRSRLALTTQEGVAEVEDTSSAGFGVEPIAPARIRVGAAYHGARFSLRIGGDYQHALRNADISVSRQAVVNGRIGVTWRVSTQWTLGGGLFTDRSPQTTPGDNPTERRVHFYGGTLGVQYGRTRRLDPAHETERALHFRSTFALRYAYGTGQTVGILLNEASPLVSPHTVHELSLYIGATMSY